MRSEESVEYPVEGEDIVAVGTELFTINKIVSNDSEPECDESESPTPKVIVWAPGDK